MSARRRPKRDSRRRRARTAYPASADKLFVHEAMQSYLEHFEAIRR